MADATIPSILTQNSPVLGQSITPTPSTTPLSTLPKTTDASTAPAPAIPAALQTPVATTTPAPSVAPTPTPAVVQPSTTITPAAVPPVLQAQPKPTISTTGLPAGWSPDQFKSNYQKEIDRIKTLNPNDPRIPLLASARAQKIAGMTPEQLQAANIDKTGKALPKPIAPAVKPAPVVKLGTLSSKYESGGNPGAISTGAGDYGGKSYGTYQFASNTGSLLSFINSLKASNPQMYNTLYGAYTKGGAGFGQNFDNAWKQLAQSDPEGFAQIQHDYIQDKYFTPAANALKTKGFDVTQHSPAVQNALWSAAVQYGVGGASKLFNAIDLKGTDEDIINNLYDHKADTVNSWFSGSSQAVRNGVAGRIQQEKQDALDMLQQQPAGGSTTQGAPQQPATSTLDAQKTAALAPVNIPGATQTPAGTQIYGKNYTNEATGKAWDVKDYTNDYSAEINRIQKIDAADPRIDTLEKARADKILAEPDKYKDLVGWANDIKTGQWNANDYKGNYQAEINRLRSTNPADPRIDRLEHLRAQKILSNPSNATQENKDWATDVDKRNWKASDYADNYQKEIDRIKSFAPNDPRIQQLSDLRTLKILANPGAYNADMVKAANDYQSNRSTQLQQLESDRGYTESEVQADLATQKAIRQIKDYYTQAGLGVGGQAAADIRQAAVAGAGKQADLEAARAAAQTAIIKQKAVDDANLAIVKAQQDVQNAKDETSLAIAQQNLQQQQIQSQIAQVDLQKAQVQAQAAAAKSVSGSSSGGSSGGSSKSGSSATKNATASAYNSRQAYYSGKLVDPVNHWYGIGNTEGNHQQIIDEVLADTALSANQQDQMLMDLNLYDEANK